jgi:hypothetical protein
MYLREATASHRQIKLTQLAQTLGVHRNTLYHHMKQHGVVRQYSALSNQDLDNLVKIFKRRKPDSGLCYVIGFLRAHGFRVQRRRVVSSVKRVDGLGSRLRERKVIKRKKYKVQRPNALWHVDGHHKLICWGFVIHGIVDGYDRTVCASTLIDYCNRLMHVW